MKKQIFLGIGLLLILLPFLTPGSPIVTSAMTDAPFQNQPELNDLQDGSKFVYNISEFQYGEGIWDILDMLLEQVEAPDFDRGLIGSLEGAEIITYIAEMDNIDLYHYNYSSYLYEDHTVAEAMQIFSMLKLNSELGVYVNASMFSFPDDFAQTDYTDFWDYWPWGDFRDPMEPEFWNGFNSSFPMHFEFGFNDNNNSWGWWGYEYPQEDWFSDGDIWGYGYEMGRAIGYDIGWDACNEGAGQPAWFDGWLALDAYYAGFYDAKVVGFSQGQADYLADKIPDKRYSGMIPAPADLYDLAYYRQYQQTYEMWYQEGFLYEGAQDNYNRELYKDLYDGSWGTYYSGYVEGYRNYYWNGYWDAYNTNPFNPPYPWTDPWDDREAGYFDGMYAGYDAGYYDGQYALNVGEQYMYGMDNYLYESYYDGFENGAADEIASLAENPVPSSLPYSASTVDPYEQGANFIYANQYAEGYHNGYVYAKLVTSIDDLNWMWHNGPFYYMTLPDFDFTLDAGSILPTPLQGFTMLTDLDLILDMDDHWDFDYGSHDYGHFNDMIIPMQTFDAGSTVWGDIVGTLVERNDTQGTPGLIGTWDVANNYFEISMEWNATNPGMYETAAWGYDTITGNLLNVTADIDFYNMTDVWASMTIELDPAKSDIITPVMPNPSAWTYSISKFNFYFDLPAVVDPGFVDGLMEFKTNGLASVGNPLLGVDMDGYQGLWAEATMTMYDPANVTRPPDVGSYEWPIFSPQGPVWMTDWELYDGLWVTADSVFSVTPYIEDALAALALQNTNVNLDDIDLNLAADQYYYVDAVLGDVIYYYVTFDAALDFSFGMLNGDYQWETTSQVGWARGALWIGIDVASGVVLGAGGQTSFNFEMTSDYGVGGGLLSAFMEMQIGSTVRTIPDLYNLISGSLPLVPEYGPITILSILGFAAIVSAVIFTRKR